MRYPSDLIVRLAAAASGIPEATDQELGVGTDLFPVLTVPGPLGDTTGFVRTLAQRESFITQLQIGRAASQAALTQDVATFGRGLWRISVLLSILANFTQASDGTISAHNVGIEDPNGNAANLLIGYSVNAVPQHQGRDFIFLFTEDGWSITHTIQATGVGQTHELFTLLSAARLL